MAGVIIAHSWQKETLMPNSGLVNGEQIGTGAVDHLKPAVHGEGVFLATPCCRFVMEAGIIPGRGVGFGDQLPPRPHPLGFKGASPHKRLLDRYENE